MVVFTVTPVIWNCDGKDSYGRDNSAFRYWFRLLQKIFLKVKYVHCYREQRFMFTWRLTCCSRWIEELLLCLVKTLNKGTFVLMHFNGDTGLFLWILLTVDPRYRFFTSMKYKGKHQRDYDLRSSHMYIRRSATLNFRDGKDRNW